MNRSTTRIKLVFAVLIPVFVSALASVWLVTNLTQDRLTKQSAHFSQAIADQLANTSVGYLISRDVLSLNVLLDDLLASDNFSFVAVYDPNNQLLAQSGKQSKSLETFTRAINFQDTNLGYVLVGFNTSMLDQKLNNVLLLALAIHAFIALTVSTIIWFYGDLLYFWIVNSPRAKNDSITTVPDPSFDAQEESVTQCTLLALKIKPARLVPMGAISGASKLYGGRLETVSNEEWLIAFNARDQPSRSLCCGLLIKELMALLPRKATFRGGIDTAPFDDLSTLRKQASYLASTDDKLLVSKRIFDALTPEQKTNNIELVRFHSTLTDSEVYVPRNLDQLIQQQAKQLLAQSDGDFT